MRKTIFFNCFLVLFFLITFSGCKKVLDYVKNHHDGTADNCKIEKVAFKWFDIGNGGPAI